MTSRCDICSLKLTIFYFLASNTVVKNLVTAYNSLDTYFSSDLLDSSLLYLLTSHWKTPDCSVNEFI